jgi:AbiV family abortive infection protein
MAKRLPSEREAASGVAMAAVNAAGLLGDAGLLAAAGRYGRALSMAVLAFEESVKARTLGAIVSAAAQGRTPGFSDSDLRGIIYNSHQARHAAGFLQHLAAMSPDVYGKLMLGMAISPAETELLRELAALLVSMNAGKQAGFYTDFDPDSGSWTAPGTVSRTEFDRIRALIGEYAGETQRQIDDLGPLQSAAAGPAARGQAGESG